MVTFISKRVFLYRVYTHTGSKVCILKLLIFFLYLQNMEEKFKQVRLQDKQGQNILEKEYSTKVSILTIFYSCVCGFYPPFSS